MFSTKFCNNAFSSACNTKAMNVHEMEKGSKILVLRFFLCNKKQNIHFANKNIPRLCTGTSVLETFLFYFILILLVFNIIITFLQHHIWYIQKKICLGHSIIKRSEMSIFLLFFHSLSRTKVNNGLSWTNTEFVWQCLAFVSVVSLNDMESYIENVK